MKLRIATRKSALAIWQSAHVAGLLRSRGHECVLLPLQTEGDRILDASLAAAGGKGLFVKELEEALLDGRADLAVHSAKDVPFALPEGFALCAFAGREDPRDALVAPKARLFSLLPQGARVGTSSLRRSIQLRAARPDLEIVPVRGNVQTRLGLAQDLDAVVLAVAGLCRLGCEASMTEALPVSLCLPAAGQGALAIEAVAGSRAELVARTLDHPAVARCVRAERAVLRGLGGGCTLPIGAYAVPVGRELWLRAVVGMSHGPGHATVVRAQRRGTDPEKLGAQIAQELLLRGAETFLEAARKQSRGLTPPPRSAGGARE